MSTRKYDPSKRYIYQNTDKIVLTGEQFGVIDRALANLVNGTIVNTSTILELHAAFSVIQSKISEYVENGIFTEYVAPSNNENIEVEKS